MLRRFQAVGIETSQIEFVGTLSRQQYLRLYHRIDVCLDTFYYTGHTTSLDSLWMGIPPVTLFGPSAVSRGTLSRLLLNLGLESLAAETEEQYIEIAVGFAHDLRRLTELRSSLRERMQSSALMDGSPFCTER